jgi:hypothetical protein
MRGREITLWLRWTPMELRQERTLPEGNASMDQFNCAAPREVVRFARGKDSIRFRQ